MIPFYGFANPQEEDNIIKEKSRNEYTRHVPFGVSHRTRNPQPAKATHGRPLEEITFRSARTRQSVARKPLRHQVLIPIRVAESVARRRILGRRATVCPLWGQQCRTTRRMPPQIPRPMFDDVVPQDDPQKTGSVAQPLGGLRSSATPAHGDDTNRILQAKTAGRSCPLAPVLRGEG